MNFSCHLTLTKITFSSTNLNTKSNRILIIEHRKAFKKISGRVAPTKNINSSLKVRVRISQKYFFLLCFEVKCSRLASPQSLEFDSHKSNSFFLLKLSNKLSYLVFFKGVARTVTCSLLDKRSCKT